MALSDAQKKSLYDAREAESAYAVWTGVFTVVAAIALCYSFGNEFNKGGIVFGICMLMLSLWCNRRRAENKSDVKYLQEQDSLS